jgi:hypothetical protein
VEIFLYFGLTLLWEKVLATPSLSAMVFGNPKVEAPNVPDEDADVLAERARLMAGRCQDAIQIKALRKVYKGQMGGSNKIAVQDLWLGIPAGQCFGYLGINGAGKTTTLKMLTGDVLPTGGTALLSGLDILTQQLRSAWSRSRRSCASRRASRRPSRRSESGANSRTSFFFFSSFSFCFVCSRLTVRGGIAYSSSMRHSHAS